MSVQPTDQERGRPSARSIGEIKGSRPWQSSPFPVQQQNLRRDLFRVRIVSAYARVFAHRANQLAQNPELYGAYRDEFSSPKKGAEIRFNFKNSIRFINQKCNFRDSLQNASNGGKFFNFRNFRVTRCRVFRRQNYDSRLTCGKNFSEKPKLRFGLILKANFRVSRSVARCESNAPNESLQIRLHTQHRIVHLSRDEAQNLGESMTNSASTTRNQRHRQLKRQLGYKETNLWIPEQVASAIEQAVKEGAYPSRQVAIAQALEAAFLPKERNLVT